MWSQLRKRLATTAPAAPACSAGRRLDLPHAPHLFPRLFEYGQLNSAGPLLGGSRIDPTAFVIRTAEGRMDRQETNWEWTSLEEANQVVVVVSRVGMNQVVEEGGCAPLRGVDPSR